LSAAGSVSPFPPITGFFDQDPKFPGCGTTAGFAVSLCVIIGLCVGLRTLFERKGWL
jgi:hypothetical protein